MHIPSALSALTLGENRLSYRGPHATNYVPMLAPKGIPWTSFFHSAILVSTAQLSLLLSFRFFVCFVAHIFLPVLMPEHQRRTPSALLALYGASLAPACP